MAVASNTSSAHFESNDLAEAIFNNLPNQLHGERGLFSEIQGFFFTFFSKSLSFTATESKQKQSVRPDRVLENSPLFQKTNAKCLTLSIYIIFYVKLFALELYTFNTIRTTYMSKHIFSTLQDFQDDSRAICHPIQLRHCFLYCLLQACVYFSSPEKV